MRTLSAKRTETINLIQFHHEEYLTQVENLEKINAVIALDNDDDYLMLVPPQGQVLKALRVFNGPVSTRDLSRFTHLEPTVINSALYALERKNLVLRTKAPNPLVAQYLWQALQ
jgi:DNA-binding MarR family transcriptional regulator